jgi:hypothetical protein
MAGRKIRDEREARRCMAKVKKSGMPYGQWAQLHGIDGRSLCAWASNLERGDTGRRRSAQRAPRGRKRARVGLVELIPGGVSASSRYTVRCGSLSIDIDEHFDAGSLARLLRVVTSC